MRAQLDRGIPRRSPVSNSTTRRARARSARSAPYGRDVEIEPGVLTLGDDYRLTLGKNPAAELQVARHRADDEATWTLVHRHPGLSVRGLGLLPVESRGKLSRDRIRRAVDRLALTNQITNKGSAAAPEWHTVLGGAPFGPSDEGAR